MRHTREPLEDKGNAASIAVVAGKEQLSRFRTLMGGFSGTFEIGNQSLQRPARSV